MNSNIQPNQSRIPRLLLTKLRRRSFWQILITLVTLTYLVFIGLYFNVGALFDGKKIDRGILLVSDMVAFKTHVTLNLRRDKLKVAIEGERLDTYSPENYPNWFKGDKQKFEISLREGYKVRYEEGSLHYFIPGYGEMTVKKEGDQIITTFPENTNPLPEGFKILESKFDARPVFDHRVQFSKSRIEIHYYEFGWENFWFPMGSRFNGLGFLEILDLILFKERLDPET